MQVVLDTQPPVVTIDSPPDGFVTATASVTIAGMINDIVIGTVNGDQARVTVNGLEALVANRSYLVPDVPLAPGVNVISALGFDAAGNSASAEIQVIFEDAMDEPEIRSVAGNNQTAPIGALLSEPLVVELLDGTGAPVEGEIVIFRVTENNGMVSDGVTSARAVT
ncbi:unnamed protein product, partial [marine sediment metagenome]